MATARIISRSQQCSRELARELLARGYAVEIVSPDAIPDNVADLELRVEADVADQLTATVDARNGGHRASLAFVHQLKAPMGDFVRRPPDTSEKVCFPAQPISFNAEPDVAGDVELLSENWRAAEPARGPEIQPDPEAGNLEILPDPEKSAQPITSLQQRLAPAKKLAEPVRRRVAVTFHGSKRLRKSFISSQALKRAATQAWESAAHRGREVSQVLGRVASQGRVATEACEKAASQVLGSAASQGRARLQSCRNHCRNIAGFSRRGLHRAADWAFPQSVKSRLAGIASSGGWLGRAAIILAVVVVVAIVLGRGIGRGGDASVDRDSHTGPGKTAAAPGVTSLTQPEPEHATAAVTVPTPSSKSEAKPAPISKTQPVHTMSKKSRAPRSRTTGDDLVADDTVTYFNKPASAPPARDSSGRRASSPKQSKGVAAASSTSPM